MSVSKLNQIKDEAMENAGVQDEGSQITWTESAIRNVTLQHMEIWEHQVLRG